MNVEEGLKFEETFSECCLETHISRHWETGSELFFFLEDAQFVIRTWYCGNKKGSIEVYYVSNDNREDPIVWPNENDGPSSVFDKSYSSMFMIHYSQLLNNLMSFSKLQNETMNN